MSLQLAIPRGVALLQRSPPLRQPAFILQHRPVVGKEAFSQWPNSALTFCVTPGDNRNISEVVYPWHPFYGQEAKIKGERNRRGTIVYVCSSDGNDGGAVVEVPAWMFDSAVCYLLHPGTQPSVCVPALRALHALLNWTRKPTEDVIEAHQSTALGGSDAQTSKDAGDSDSPLSGTCPNAAVVPGHQSQDRTSFGSITSPTRKPKHRRTK